MKMKQEESNKESNMAPPTKYALPTSSTLQGRAVCGKASVLSVPSSKDRPITQCTSDHTHRPDTPKHSRWAVCVLISGTYAVKRGEAAPGHPLLPPRQPILKD